MKTLAQRKTLQKKLLLAILAAPLALTTSLASGGYSTPALALNTDTELYKWMTTQSSKAGKTKVESLPSTPTTVSLTNNTAVQTYFYINLTPPSGTVPSYPTSEEITSLSNVTSTASGPNTAPEEGQIQQIDSQHGYFFLNTGDTVSFATTPANNTFSAQIFTNGTNPSMTGAFPNNSQCVGNVNNQGTPLNLHGRGATFAEFTINADTSYMLPDTVDISEVNGVNALYKMVLPPIPSQASSVNYPKFFCCSSYLWSKQTGKFAQGQYIPVASIANRPGLHFPYTGDATKTLTPISPAEYRPGGRRSLTYSAGTVGVYPFGCDQCTQIVKPGCGSKSDYGATMPQKHKICQVSRPVPNLGGNINIQLLTFPYPPASAGKMSNR